MTLNNNASFAKRTVTLASLVLYLAVASSGLFTPALALASGDPEANKADDSVAAAAFEGSSDVAVADDSSTAFIMGDVATLLGAKDMDEAAGESSNDAGERRLVELPGTSSKKNHHHPEKSVFSFIFGGEKESPSSRAKHVVAETVFPMSWDVPLAPSTRVALASTPRRSLRPCHRGHHGREDPGRYAGLVALARVRDGDEAPFPREGFGVTTWVVCVDVIALLVTVVALVIITVLAMLLLDLCLCCFGGCCARDDDDARRADTADAATETLLPRPVLEGDKPAKR